jgi:transcriptional antiterminator NusG
MKAAIDLDKSWYVVRANIKCEAKAANNIRLAGFDVYYPRQRYEVKHRRTNVYTTRERPLMIPYLFVGFHKKQKHFGFVRACEGVERLLEVQGEPIPVPAQEVQAIFLAEIDMAFDDTRSARIHRKEEAKTRQQTLEMKFQAGRHVQIKEGPFADLHAIVDEVTKTGNVKAMVKLFGRLTSVEFEADKLLVA